MKFLYTRNTRRKSVAFNFKLSGEYLLKRRRPAQPKQVFTFLLTFVVLTGCAQVSGLLNRTKDNAIPPNPLPTLRIPFEIRTLWSHAVTDGARTHHLKLVPAIGENRVFVAGFRGKLNALALDSGRRLWSVNTQFRISGGTGYGEGLVVVGTEEGEVVAFSDVDGKLAWKSQLTSEILAPPQVADGIAVVRTTDGRLFGLHMKNGEALWVYDSPVPSLSLRGTSAPALNRYLAICGFDSGRVVAVGLKDGREIWEARASIPVGRTELQRMVDVDAEPVIADGVVYTVTYQGRLAAIDLDTGNILWRRDMSSHSGLTLDEQRIFVSDTEDFIWALSRETGATLWRQEKLRGRKVGAPAVFQKHILIGDSEGYVHWIDTATGEIVGRTHVDEKGIFVRPVVAGDTVIVLGNGGQLAALVPPAGKR